MSATRLVLPQQLSDEIEAKARLSLETAGVLLVSIVEISRQELKLLGRRIFWIDESAYQRREHNSLSISSEGYVHALSTAENLGASAVWIHTHPGLGSSPLPSTHDKVVDEQLSELFRLRSSSPFYGAIVFSPREEAFSFVGHIESSEGQRLRLERMWIVGNRFRLIHAFDLPAVEDSDPSPVFDRNIRAFGGAIQHALSSLHIGVVGCGGTGSAVAEQLTRLGVRHLTLIDPELLSASNVTRVYGSALDDVGTPKVEVVARHLRRIASDADIVTIEGTINRESVARQLIDCDIVFGCTDDNSGRLVLSRIATYLLLPVIDCGVILTSDEHFKLIGIDGRVTVLSPGQACLVCRNRIDLARAAAELLSPEERVRRQDEGYAPALAGIEPSVITFTTIVGASAVSEIIERLVGYGPEPRPSEVLLRLHEREISTNRQDPCRRHYCDPLSGKLGAGVTVPFLEQTWPD